MLDREVLQAIYAAIDAVNDDLPADRRLVKRPDTILFGSAGALDSLHLVELIAQTELEIADALGVEITIASEKALSRKRSPFHSVANLAEYVIALVKNAPG